MNSQQAEQKHPISHSGESSFVPGQSRQVLTQTFGKAKSGQQVIFIIIFSDPNIQHLQKPQSNQAKNQGGRKSQNFDDSSRVNISSVRGPDDIMEADPTFDEKLRRNQREAQMQNQDYRVESAKSNAQDKNLDFNLIERSRMSQGQKTLAQPSRVDQDSRLLYTQNRHGSPRMRNVDFLTNDNLSKTAGKDDGQMQLHQMMTASLGTTAVHDVLLQTPNSHSMQQSLNANPNGIKRQRANNDRGSLPPASTGKGKSKKRKQQQALQEVIQNTSGYHQILSQAQSPNKKRNYIVKGGSGSVAQNAQHYAQQVVAVNNSGPAYQSVQHPSQPQIQPMTAQTQGSGQNPSGQHGRRRVYDLNKEIANNKISQQRLNPAAGLQSMTAIHSKRASQSNQPYTTQQQKKNQSMSNNSQTYVYFNQIREAAERGINVNGPTSNNQQHSNNKQTKHRRQPQPIDTFNLVGNRRDSFFNKVKEESTKNEQIQEEQVNHEYTVSAPVGSTATAQMINVQPTVASASAGTGLILPDIGGTNRKTGMSHGQQQTSNAIKSTNAHRASNSFSGKTGGDIAINTNGSIAEVVNQSMGMNNKVFSDSGIASDNPQRSQMHTRAQASADLANSSNLQQPPVLRGGNQQAYLLNANINVVASQSNDFNVKQTAVSEDLRRRTTGSLFTSPQGHSNVQKRQIKDSDTLKDPSDVLSLSTNQAQLKHVQNIVSPIQYDRDENIENINASITNEKQHNNIMVENHKDSQQRTLQGSIPGLPDSGTISRDNSVFFDSVMNKMNPRQGMKKQEILATSKSQRKASKQRKIETNLSRRQDSKRQQYQQENMKTPKPQNTAENEFGSAVQQPTGAPGDLLSGLNSLLSSQPRPFDQIQDDEFKPSEKESNSKQAQQDLSIDQEEEGEDEEEENELLESVAENFTDIQDMPDNQHSQPSFGVHPELSQNRYKKAPEGYSGQTGTDYYHHVSSQLNQAGGKKKKGKRHRRLNTHHHYHIDLNFEQVNNILVSYGGVAQQQLFKPNKKESSKNQNVSLSLSGVMNNQQRGQSTQNQQRQFSTNATSPMKKVNANQNPQLQLPELIINKNKINFNQKPANNNQQQEAMAVQAAAMRTSSRKVENNGFITYGTNQRPSKSQKRQAAAGGSLKPKKKGESYQTASSIIDESMTRGEFYPQRKVVKDPKNNKQQFMDRMPIHTQQVSQAQMGSHNQIQSSQQAEEEVPSIIVGPDANVQDSRISNAQMNDSEENKQQSKLSQQWKTADRQVESRDEKLGVDQQESGNMRQTVGNFKQSSATPHTKAMLQQKSITGNTGAGKFRQKQQLQVQTFKHHQNAPINSAMETPKRYFNVKQQSSKKVVKMAVMEHNSAGLRPSRSGVKEREDEPKHTLSQISSVVSNNDSEHLNKPVRPKVDNRKQPSVKYGIHRVESIRKKQNQLEQQFQQTHKILEQFNQNLNEQSGIRRQEVDCPSPTSPMKKQPEKKKQYKPKITDFEIQCTVGVGNFGKVHKAFNKDQNRYCALKVLQKESVAEMKHVDHVINEREVLQYISDINQYIAKPVFVREHKQIGSMSRVKEDSDSDDFIPCNECPFIMNIYSSFQDLDNLYFELEYIEGCTLLSQIREYNQQVMSNMPYYAAEVLMTLEYLHNNLVIYRDLKPENIVISMGERGHLKLVDFGFAKKLKNIKERTHTNCGTPAYISPEVLSGASGHGYEADIWSLGVLMVEITSGQTPFSGESTQEVYENVTKCQPVYNKQISATLRDLLDKIFVGDPETRISLEQIKKHPVYKDYDFSVTMPDRYRSYGPWIPDEPIFNEKADRDSEQMQEAAPKPKNILAALMGNPMADQGGDKAKPAKNLNFDEAFYDKFEREAKKNAEKEGETETRVRKRQNPLGDFKFKKINELF